MSGLTSQPPLGSIAAGLEAHGARHRPERAGLADDRRILAERAVAIRRIRERHPLRHRRCLRARNAGGPIHQSPRTGPLARHRGALARGIRGPMPPSTSCSAIIVKVTPTSKVVGDMALMMVTSGLSSADVLDPNRQIAFPESVVSLVQRRGRTAPWRVSGSPAEENPERRESPSTRDPARPAAGRFRSDCASRPKNSAGARCRRMNLPPTWSIRRSSRNSPARSEPTATFPSCRRRFFSMACSRRRNSPSRSTGERRFW